MPDEKNAVSNFLNEMTESKDIFEEKETEEPVVEQEVDEKPLPFHKDPKVQRYVERQIANALKDVKPSAEQDFRESVSSDVKDVIGAFTTIIGNDTPEKIKALAALEKTLNGADERASTKAIERFQQQIKAQKDAETAAETAALEELNAGFETIEETHGVDLEADKKARTAFIEYLKKVSHKNAQGEVDQFADIPSAWEEFQDKGKRPQPSRAKELASRGMVRSSDAAVQSPQGSSWKDTDRYFVQLAKQSN